MDNNKILYSERSALIKGHEVRNIFEINKYHNLFLEDLGSIFDEGGDYNKSTYVPPNLFWLESNLIGKWNYIIFVPSDHLGITSKDDKARKLDFRKYLCVGIENRREAMFFKLSVNNVTQVSQKKLNDLNMGTIE